jgi:capsular exopolysaccharide synthesis family protein
MTKFFEALNKGAEDLNGVGLPFSSEDLKNQPDHRPAEQILVSQANHKEPPSSKPEYRTASIRVPAGAPILPFDGAHTLAAERYRIIRTKIVQHAAAPRVICVSSTTPGDGKTVTALNIASSLALKKDTTAILVDVDLRRPQLAALLGISDAPGLAEFLGGGRALGETVVRVAEMPSLYFLAAGRCLRNPAELLDSNRWRSLVASLRKEFDYVVVDCPPMGVVADYDLIHTVADGVVLVARPGHSNRKLLYKGLEQVPESKLLGIVINCVEDWFLWRAQDSPYYRYTPDSPSGK